MNYCSYCGHPVQQQIPPGDNRLRHVCSQCHQVHYQNPRIVAGCLPVCDMNGDSRTDGMDIQAFVDLLVP